MNTERRKRNDALQKAKSYALRGSVFMAHAWLEKASSYEPLTEMQRWRIRKEIGPVFEKSKLPVENFLGEI